MSRPTSPPPKPRPRAKASEPSIIYDSYGFGRDFDRWMKGEIPSVDLKDYGTEVKYNEPPEPPPSREIKEGAGFEDIVNDLKWFIKSLLLLQR